MKFAKVFFAFLLGAVSFFAYASAINDPHIVILPRPQSEKDWRYEYRKQLLQLILDKTASEYKQKDVANYSKEIMSQERAIVEIRAGSQDVTVIGTPSSPTREESLYPIRIPIEKGISGYRILLINKSLKQVFENISTLNDLKKYSACFKKEWVDSQILTGNGITLEDTNAYESLFKKLDADHCSWFPRGINEIFTEYEQRKNELKNIVVENKIALYYKFPVYFFVSKSNTLLANRIENGFKIILADGSFNELFLKFHGDFIKNADLKNRRIIQLENPLLPKDTPLDKKEYWIQFH